MSFNGLYYPAYTAGFGSKPRFQSTHPFRHLIAAGSNMNNQWSGATDQSGYGGDPSDYDYNSGPSAHVPSGGSYSYQAATGTGYGPPAAPAIHPPPKSALGGGGGGGKKGIFGGNADRKSSSTMSAVTLLSFLFFINLLQGCIKDHMDAMNPTVMVMTTNVIRNRFNKMGEMNSREQSPSYSSNAANIVVNPADLVAAAAQLPSKAQSTGPSVNLQSPYSNNPATYNKPLEQNIPVVSYPAQQQPAPQYMHNNPEPEVPISYAKPSYDPHKPDPYEHMTHLPPPQQPAYSYNNHTLVAQPPPYKLPPLEQHYNYHHTEYNAQPPPQPSIIIPQYSQSQNPFYEQQHPEYNAQPPPQPSIIIPQYSNSQNPFYEHQHPATSKPYNDEAIPQYGGPQNEYNFRQKHEMPVQQNSPASSSPNNPYPWSSNMQSGSVVSGPFRRASIMAVSPKTKWITVPAKITDRTHFDEHVDEAEEVMEHHDDRDVFRSRFN
ncbi:uncharacterized protein LOC135959859 [Calliphora vicina]|uniref:uncharacterized protein LOC135959859 n=1 Tax=Calliphora vicina TaxID=7373 RepID=UPI00325B83CC